MASDDADDAANETWRPKGAVDQYAGMPVWDHDPGPHEHNDGEFDGDVTFEDSEEADDDDAA